MLKLKRLSDYLHNHSHLNRSDRADAIIIWLETHGVGMAWELAPTFVNTGLDIVRLEEFISKLPASSHADALNWLEAQLI